VARRRKITKYDNKSKIFEDFVAISRYCRWMPDKGRRETWKEAVERYFNYITDRFNLSGRNKILDEIKEAMINREVFGSMRALMTAGPALDVDDVAAYNCSYISVSRVSDFKNIMYILMCGTGVGFSCEEDSINNLPEVPPEIKSTNDEIVVDDSRVGWATSYHKFLHSLYSGYLPAIDTSKIRQAGTRLKTFGGRASGPEPLERLIRFTTNMFENAKGRRLKSIEVHDLVCQIAEIVICGGVRRSALISLSDLHNREMALAKSGPWWETAGHRSLANNSAVYESKPEMSGYLQEWSSLYDSHSGERGICNREAMKNIAKKAGRKTEDIKFGTNPCSEIILRPNQFCNLSTTVIKADDDMDWIRTKIIYATILGTIQSAMTNFTFFDECGDYRFKDNCEEERLLGVSMTGIMDHSFMNGMLSKDLLSLYLKELKEIAKETNKEWAEFLGIPQSASVTCIKPEGTTSCVAGTASGLHPRHSEYYIRRIRLDSSDPIGQLMIDAGIPHEPCVMRSNNTMVFSFPIKSPENSLVQHELTALYHLDLWEVYQEYYCDHKPSITISYSDDEFLEIGAWVWENWDVVSGISFLPKENHVYQQAPFETISEEEYNSLIIGMPSFIEWGSLSDYEKKDETKNMHELSCTAGGCEII